MKRLAVLLCMISFLPALKAQEDLTPEEGEKVTEITSDRLDADYRNKKAVFTGNVKVSDPDMTLTSETLILWLTDEDEIRLIEAEGSVVIRMEGLSSQSGKAVYNPSTGKLELTDRPQVSRKGSILQAKKFTYFQLEDRLKAEDGVRLLNFQNDGDKREP